MIQKVNAKMEGINIGKVVYGMRTGKSVIYEYRYENRQDSSVQVWLAVPPSTATQKPVETTFSRPALEQTELYGQELAYFDLDPGEKIDLTMELELFPAGIEEFSRNPGKLSDEERDFYLRSGIMSPVNSELRLEAEKIVGNAKDGFEKAERLFHHFHKTFQYKYPPKNRGALYFREAGKGDCGEFSFLYTSYMRSLGIPCRTVVGSFAKKFGAHVWNEIWLDQYGWLPVDTSMPALLKKPLSQIMVPVQMGTATKKTAYFGNFDGKRVVFSLDADWPLTPLYKDTERDQRKELFVFGREIEFGYQSLEGTAPYLQPIYPRFNGDMKPAKVEDMLGMWNIQEKDAKSRSLALVKRWAFTVFVVMMFASALNAFANIDFISRLPVIEIGYGAAFIGLSAMILRKEANWFIILLTLAVLIIEARLVFT